MRAPRTRERLSYEGCLDEVREADEVGLLYNSYTEMLRFGVLAVAASRYLSALPYGVSPLDPATLVVVILMLTAVVFLASLLPARRAATVDPSMALRND